MFKLLFLIALSSVSIFSTYAYNFNHTELKCDKGVHYNLEGIIFDGKLTIAPIYKNLITYDTEVGLDGGKVSISFEGTAMMHEYSSRNVSYVCIPTENTSIFIRLDTKLSTMVEGKSINIQIKESKRFNSCGYFMTHPGLEDFFLLMTPMIEQKCTVSSFSN